MNNITLYQTTHQGFQFLSNKIIQMNQGEYILYLVLAFILGYFFHYFFSHRRDYVRSPKKKPAFYYTNKLNASYYPYSEPFIPETKIIPVEEIHHHYRYVDKAQNQQKNQIQKTTKQRKEQQRDDLKIIEGIGPKIEEVLQKAGIHNFDTLKKTPIKKLKEILEKAGKSFIIHDPSTWPEQAFLAANKEWEKLKKLQDKLIGGKRIINK